MSRYIPRQLSNPHQFGILESRQDLQILYMMYRYNDVSRVSTGPEFTREGKGKITRTPAAGNKARHSNKPQ